MVDQWGKRSRLYVVVSLQGATVSLLSRVLAVEPEGMPGFRQRCVSHRREKRWKGYSGTGEGLTGAGAGAGMARTTVRVERRAATENFMMGNVSGEQER